MQRQHAIALGVVILAVLFVILSGDSRSSVFMMRDSLGVTGSAAPAMMDGDFYAYDEAVSDKSFAANLEVAESLGTTAADVDQKVIKTADLELEVDSASETAQALATLATEKGGFVQSSSVDEDVYGNKRTWVTIRVPADQFETALTDIKAMADKVVTESTQGQDVTEEYTDLEARLGAAEAQEAQYLIILESATTVGEVLAVQEHLAEVRAQIESLKGQINYLENRTSMSTISVSAVETSRVTIPTDKFDLGDEIRDAARTLVALVQKLLVAIIWLVIIGGPVALVAFLSYKLAIAIRNRK
ncbi:DUF4349 domain-containing protein [Candidatus Uhrbacteria bacterium]|nr:DUF4349 domain-containing protein [Candidatus Uhrbacteria bacterium]